MGVAVEQQQPTSHVPSPSASADRTEDAQATCLQQEIAEEAEKGDDGLLLLPANLSGSLRSLEIYGCRQLSMVACPPPLPNGGKTERGGEGGGLLALRSLQVLQIDGCLAPSSGQIWVWGRWSPSRT
jgi:hypothetical protein